MKHSAPTFPRLRHHKPSGRAVVTVRAIDGSRKDMYLGPWGSKEATEEYNRLIARLAAAPKTVVPSGHPAADLTVNEGIVAFAKHVEDYYPAASSEAKTFKLSLRPVKLLFGHLPAVEFGPRCLKAVRDQFVEQELTRGEVNRRTRMVRRMFKWLAAEEIVPATTYHALATVEGLRRGRSKAGESEPVLPVADAVVEATLPLVNRYVAGMIRFQRLTGCRPGEVCGLRMADVVKTGATWLYQPAEHKTAYRGKDRRIVIGPKAQQLLDAFPTADPNDFVFSPARAVAELRAERANNRATPRWASHAARNAGKRKANPKRSPRDHYTSASYGRSILRAARTANKERDADNQLPLWHPNQLRHTFATEVRRVNGLEAAQVLLGHASADVTQIYAERNLSLAQRVALEVG